MEKYPTVTPTEYAQPSLALWIKL